MKNPLKKLIKKVTGKKTKRKKRKFVNKEIKKEDKEIVDRELLEKLREAGYRGPFGAEKIKQQTEEIIIAKKVKRRGKKKVKEVILEEQKLQQQIQQPVQQIAVPIPSAAEPQKELEERKISTEKETQSTKVDKIENAQEIKTEPVLSPGSGIDILFSEPKKVNLSKKKILDDESKS